jgi:Caspase domain
MSVDLYALLIGAEFYFPNLTEEGTIFPSLKGCVRDITRVEEELLKTRLSVPPERILKLRASNPGDGSKKPPEPPAEWPTYENITAKFDELIAMAPPKSQVYIHYSGHGGRATSIWKDLKGSNGIDETIVPINIEDVAFSRYLRDLELARLIRKMVDKELVVTVVLDSCHSGGMTRGDGNDIGIRGSAIIDTRERPLDQEPSRVASREELIDNWKGMTAKATRSVKANSGWLPEPNGYVLLAACKESESAIEFAFNGSGRSGALTHWLLHALQEMGPHISWKQVHDRVLAKINSQFASQTPQLEGEVDRQVFGLQQVPPVYAVRVLQFDQPDKRVKLNTGEALGAAIDAGYAIFPANTSDFTDTTKRLAVAKLTAPGATESWAKITDSVANLDLQGGEQAVLVDSGVAALRGRVRLVTEPPPPSKAEREAALLAIETAIQQFGQGFLKIVNQNEATNYQVAISEEGFYEILDAQGKPFNNMRPALKISDAKAAETIVARLRHLYKFHTVEQLRNADVLSPLAGKLTIEVFKAPADAKSFQAPAVAPEPLIGAGGQRTIEIGQSFYLHVRNNSAIDLNIAILDLDSAWSITQVMPPPKLGLETFPLGKNEELWLSFKAKLEPQYETGAEILKVFAAIGPARFRFLELPNLDEPFVSRTTRGLTAASNVMEQLMSEFNDDQPHTRSVELEVGASAEWIVAEVALHLHR